MSPQAKKLASALAVAIAGAVLVVLGNWVPHLPEGLQAVGVAVLASVSHYVDAWGHQDRVAAQVTDKVAAALGQEK